MQYPGRETRIRETPYADLRPLVEAARLALSPYFDGPFCFLGHSMGALVAFELARRLYRHRGVCPAHLFACGHAAPQFPYRSALRYDLPQEQLVGELRKLDGTPQEAIECPELLEFVLPLLRADLRVCQLYEFEDGEPLPCPITACGGIGDAEATVDELSAWREQTRSKFELKMFPGRHFFTQSSRQDFLGTLSADLRGLLNGH